MKTYNDQRITVPNGWTLDFNSKFIGPSHNDYGDDPEQPVFKRKGVFARNCTDFSSAHRIDLRSHHNGSGSSAFGGAQQWPAVISNCSFNENEYELAVKFAHDLGEFIDRWMKVRDR